MQGIDAVTHCCKHALDLMIFPLGQGQAQLVGRSDFSRRCRNRFQLVVQQHPRQQLVDLRLIQRVPGRSQINLGHLAFAGRQHMVQLAIVGNHQQAGGVLIQPPDRLHTAFAQLRRDQFQHAEVMLRLARALIACRLVEDDGRLFQIRPIHPIHSQHQALGRHIDKRVVTNLAINGNPFMANQRPAALTGTKAMFLKDTFELHAADVNTPGHPPVLTSGVMQYNAPMNFEHLIQINDPQNPLVVSLSRDDLWRGLLHRVEDAVPFLPGLEACRVVERHSDHLLRELDFGAAVIRDRVTMASGEWVRFDILPSEQHAGGSLTITIEEPEGEQLFLRFAYVTSLGQSNNPEELAYIDYIKSAYHQSDVDCVRVIRTLAAGGNPQ